MRKKLDTLLYVIGLAVIGILFSLFLVATGRCENIVIDDKFEKEAIASINAMYPQLNKELNELVIKVRIRKGYYDLFYFDQEIDTITNSIVVNARNYHKPITTIPTIEPIPTPLPEPIPIPEPPINNGNGNGLGNGQGNGGNNNGQGNDGQDNGNGQGNGNGGHHNK